MTLPPDDFLEEHLKELNRTLSEASAAQREEERAQRSGVGRRAEDHNWRRWLSEHLPAFFGVMALLTMTVGALGARVLSNEEREHAEFRQGIKDLQTLSSSLDRRMESQERRVSEYGDTASRALKIMEDMRTDQLNALRAAAEVRGDDRSVATYDKKLRALAASKTSGQ